MKYVMTWKKKQHGTTAAYEAAQKRVLALMRGLASAGGGA